MGFGEKVIRNLRSATADQTGLNRRILHLRKCFREVEKKLRRK